MKVAPPSEILDPPLTSAAEMFGFLNEKFRRTVVIMFVSTTEVADTAAQLKQRFSQAAPVKGTLHLHSFTPVDTVTETLLVSKLSGRPGQLVKVSRRKVTAKLK